MVLLSSQAFDVASEQLGIAALLSVRVSVSVSVCLCQCVRLSDGAAVLSGV